MKISVLFEPDSKQYFGWSPDFAGVLVEGATIEETKQLQKQAMLVHIETMMINNIPLSESIFVRRYKNAQRQFQQKKSQKQETEELILAFARVAIVDKVVWDR